jgi:hypothetical protein
MPTPQQIVDRILRSPDKGDTERLVECIPDPRLARRLLVDAMFLQRVRLPGCGNFLWAMKLLGLGDEESRIELLLRDSGQPLATRAVASVMLGQVDRDLLRRIFLDLDPDDNLDLLAAPAVALVGASVENPKHELHLAHMLAAMSGDSLGAIFDRVEAERRRGLVSALLYHHCLAEAALAPVHSRMIDALVSEGSEHTLKLLYRLRDAAADPAAHRELQKAVLTVETRLIEGGWRKP